MDLEELGLEGAGVLAGLVGIVGLLIREVLSGKRQKEDDPTAEILSEIKRIQQHASEIAPILKVLVDDTKDGVKVGDDLMRMHSEMTAHVTDKLSAIEVALATLLERGRSGS